MRQSITHGREPGELKHLSTRRKKNNISFFLERKFDLLSSGERKGGSPNRGRNPAGLRTAKREREVRGMVLGKPAAAGESPVPEDGKPQQDPEYGGARETLPETGGTTPQG